MYLGGFIFKFTGGGNPPGKTCYKKRLGKTRVKPPNGMTLCAGVYEEPSFSVPISPLATLSF